MQKCLDIFRIEAMEFQLRDQHNSAEPSMELQRCAVLPRTIPLLLYGCPVLQRSNAQWRLVLYSTERSGRFLHGCWRNLNPLLLILRPASLNNSSRPRLHNALYTVCAPSISWSFQHSLGPTTWRATRTLLKTGRACGSRNQSGFMASVFLCELALLLISFHR